MATRELKTKLSPAESLRPQVVAGNVTGEIVDTRDFDSATVVWTAGAIVASGNVTLKLQHSDTTTGGDFADVTSDDLAGAFPAALLTNTVGVVGYRGPRRYLRVMATLNSGTSVAASACILRGHPHNTTTL